MMSSDSSPELVETEICSNHSLSSELGLDFAYSSVAIPALMNKRETKDEVLQNHKPESLLVLTAKTIAVHFPFEFVESGSIIVPEELQKLIAFHSFPTDEDDIWLYSCLSCGGSYEFTQGEALWADKAVKECMQIGFHLSATVLTSLHMAPAVASANSTEQSNTGNAGLNLYYDYYFGDSSDIGEIPAERSKRPGINIEPGYPAHRVSLTFDRQRITSCSCTCSSDMEERCATIASPQNIADGTNNNATFPHTVPFSNGTQLGNSAESNSSNLWQFTSANRGIRERNTNFSRQRSTRSNVSLLRGSFSQPSTNHPSGWTSQSSRTHQSPCKPYTDLIPTSVHTPVGTWCSHVVATCLMRIREPEKVLLRAPISESLSKLSKEDLQKFAQNLICHVGPKKMLPAAQRILDQLLASNDNPIKNSAGAPDPTIGGSLGDAAAWCFDGGILENKLHVTLQLFCITKPVFYSDIGSLSSDLPSEFENFHCVLRSLRANKPRGLWDLLAIIRNMMKRQDNNGVLLLEIVTRCVLDINKLIHWWCAFQVESYEFPDNASICQKQKRFAALWFCEEIVQLWTLACLNPLFRPHMIHFSNKLASDNDSLSNGTKERNLSGQFDGCWLLQQIIRRLRAFHKFVLELGNILLLPNSFRSYPLNVSVGNTISLDKRKNVMLKEIQTQMGNLSSNEAYVHKFLGFKPALAASSLTWPADLPPTFTISATEFRHYLPKFNGSRVILDNAVIDYASNLILFAKNFYSSMQNSRIESNYWDKQSGDDIGEQDLKSDHLFDNIPLPKDYIEYIFTRFQSLDAHGYNECALHWARYLALLLIYTSNDFLNESEQIAYEVIGKINNNNNNNIVPHCSQSVCSTNQDSLDSNANFTSGHHGTHVQGNSRRQRKQCMSSSSSSHPSNSHNLPVTTTTNSNNTRNSSTRFKKANYVLSSNTVANDKCLSNSSKIDPVNEKLAITWAEKVLCWLNRIRCLMECLTRSYNEISDNSSNSIHNHHIPNTGRNILTIRGIYPKIMSFNSSTYLSNKLNTDYPEFINEWKCIDIELAFRLGLSALSFSRPPTSSPVLEIKFFDTETILLNYLCSLPVHIACPHVLTTIRYEAKKLISGLSSYQKDISVPYNLAIYLFHQLVGSLESTPNSLPNTSQSTNYVQLDSSTVESGQNGLNNATVNEYIFDFSMLTNSAVLGDSSLPLVKRISNSSKHIITGEKNSGLNKYKSTDSMIDFHVASDAELGFETIVSILGIKSRVPEKLYTNFIEAQRAQEDATIIYLLRFYRDNVSKLDRILFRLLDHYYNPYFKAPPLWACLNLGPVELMHFQSTGTGFCSVPEVDKICSLNISTTENINCANIVDGIHLDIPSNSTELTPIIDSNSDIQIKSKKQISTDANSFTDCATNSIESNQKNDLQAAVILSDEVCLPKENMNPNHCVSVDSCTNTNIINTDSSNSNDFEHNEQTTKSIFNPDSTGKLYSIEPASASEDTDTLSDSRMDGFRYFSHRSSHWRMHHSTELAAVDTSAPETTSSDNSPAAIRRLLLIKQKPSAAQTTESSDGGCGVVAEKYRQLSTATSSSELASSSNLPVTNVPAALSVPETVTKHSSSHLKQFTSNKPPRPRTLAISLLPHSSSFSSFSEDDDHVPARASMPSNEGEYSQPIQQNFTFRSLTFPPPQPRFDDTNGNILPNLPFDSSHVNEPYSLIEQATDLNTQTSSFNNENSNKLCDNDLAYEKSEWPAHCERPPPQRLSNSMAFHAFQLAKIVHELAGGPSSSSAVVFVDEPETNVHRNLQLVAFQLGIYGLGLLNILLPSWQNRSFSQNEVWISQQVFEIGIPAACILYHSWQQHFTATELASIAFQLSRQNNRALVDIAAELCLASLSQCTTLKLSDLYRALEQCGAHSSWTLERGLLCTERSAGHSDIILPEIYFFLARNWFSLHESSIVELEKALETMNQQGKSQVQLDEIKSGPDGFDNPISSTSNTPSSISAPVLGSITSSVSEYLPTSSIINHPANINASNLRSQFQNYCPTNFYQQHIRPVVYQNPASLTFDRNLNNVQGPGSNYTPQFYYPQLLTLRPQTMISQPMTSAQSSQLISSYLPKAHLQGFESYPTQISPMVNQSVPSMMQLRVGPSVPPPAAALTQLPSYSNVPPFLPQNNLLSAPMNVFPGAQFNHMLIQPIPSSDPIQQNSVPNLSVVNSCQPNEQYFEPCLNYNQTVIPGTQQSLSCDSQTGLSYQSIESVRSSINNAQQASLNMHASENLPVATLTPSAIASNRRLPSTNTASSSVVVHPSMSDRASTFSETDSSRHPESIIDGNYEDNTSSVNVPTFETNQTSKNNSEQSTSTTTVTELQSLKLKAHIYLYRAFTCAKSAIQQIIRSQAGTNVNHMSANEVYAFPTPKNSRGKHHHYQSNSRNNMVSHSQRRIPVSCTGAGIPVAKNNTVTERVPPISTSETPAWRDVTELTSGAKSILDSYVGNSVIPKSCDAHILWTFDVAISLGPSAVNEYCSLILQCVKCPILMEKITTKVIDYFEKLRKSQLYPTNINGSRFEPLLSLNYLQSPITDQSPNGNNSTQSPQNCPDQTQVTNQLYQTQFASYPICSTYSVFPNNTQNWLVHPNSIPDSNILCTTSNYQTYYPPQFLWANSSLNPTISQASQINELIYYYRKLGLGPDQTINTITNPVQLNSIRANEITPLYLSYQSNSWSNVQSSNPTQIKPIHNHHDNNTNTNTTTTNNNNIHNPNHSASMREHSFQQYDYTGKDVIEKLINRTHSLFQKYIDQRLLCIGQNQSEWDDFVDLILKAYNVHLNMPFLDYDVHWNNLLTHIRRHYKCTPALWQRILAGIQTADLKRSN